MSQYISKMNMLMNIICISLIFHLHISCINSSIVFGIKTPDSSFCCGTTLSSVTLTLYWDTFTYQCHVNPTETNTYYSCDTSDTMTTPQCTSNASHSVKYGLQIDNDHPDLVGIDRVIIKKLENGSITNILYNIEYFCFNLSSPIDNCNENGWDMIQISNEHTFPHNLVEFISNNESYVHIMQETADCDAYTTVYTLQSTQSATTPPTYDSSQIIIIGICIVTGCCIIPLTMGICICCYMALKWGDSNNPQITKIVSEERNDVYYNTKNNNDGNDDGNDDKNHDGNVDQFDDEGNDEDVIKPLSAKELVNTFNETKQLQLKIHAKPATAPSSKATDIYSISASKVTSHKSENEEVSSWKTHETNAMDIDSIMSIIGSHGEAATHNSSNVTKTRFEAVDSADALSLNETLDHIMGTTNNMTNLEVIDDEYEYKTNSSMKITLDVPSTAPTNKYEHHEGIKVMKEKQKDFKIVIIDSTQGTLSNASLKSIMNVPSIPSTIPTSNGQFSTRL